MRRWKAGLPAPMDNVCIPPRCAMDSNAALMGVMRPLSYVETTARRLAGADLPAQMGNASGPLPNVTETRTALTGAMRSQRHVGPTAEE